MALDGHDRRGWLPRGCALAAFCRRCRVREASLETEIPDDPCVVVLSSSGALARIEGFGIRSPERPARAPDGWRVQLADGALAGRGDPGWHFVASRSYLPAPRFETGLSLAGAMPSSMLLNTDVPAVGLLNLHYRDGHGPTARSGGCARPLQRCWRSSIDNAGSPVG